MKNGKNLEKIDGMRRGTKTRPTDRQTAERERQSIPDDVTASWGLLLMQAFIQETNFVVCDVTDSIVRVTLPFLCLLSSLGSSEAVA